jgi:hypothetical protein
MLLVRVPVFVLLPISYICGDVLLPLICWLLFRERVAEHPNCSFWVCLTVNHHSMRGAARILRLNTEMNIISGIHDISFG